jgi:hypothetical protein
MRDPAPPLPRAAVLALSVLTVLVVGALSLALFWGDIVEDDEPATATATTAVPGGDDFERPDAEGLAAEGHDWIEERGTWAVRDAHAALATGAFGEVAGLAVLPTDGTSVLQATATAVEPGWGLAFRVQNASNFWAVVARPDRGSWSLVHVAGGVVDEREDIVRVEPTDRSVVRVDLAGELIRVTIDQNPPVEGSDPALVDATDVGLVALDGGSLASMAWDDVTVSGN